MVFAAACGDDDNGGAGDADVTPGAPVTRGPSPARTPSGATATAPAGTPPADEVEVRGVVGSVNPATNVIFITRLSGAEVDEIVILAGTTEIRDPDGGVIALSDVRPSDRIVARGEADRGRLIAREIAVQEAVLGGEPGG